MTTRKRHALARNPNGGSLRTLPSVDQSLKVVTEMKGFEGLSRDYLKRIVQAAHASLRAEVQNRARGPETRDGMLHEIVRRVQSQVEADLPPLTPVINATGVVLHTNLGRAVLAEAAVTAVAQAARSPVNLEYDLEAGDRGDRDSVVESELCALTAAEAATVVNNNAAAVLLALNTLAEGREVVVSRGELIEIGGSFRIPEVMAKSGARLHEVGTTNRTHARDYIQAIGPTTALLLKVHPSNYRIVGFTAEVGLEELVAIGRSHSVEVMEDLGSGALIDLAPHGLPSEPVVADRIAAGAALVTFSGDKLLGGPQAGIVVGKRELVARLKANPLKRALRCDKLTLAALSATLRLYLRSANLAAELPTLRLMKRSVRELAEAAERIRVELRGRLGDEFELTVAASTSQIGSGALPAEELESRALRVTHRRLSPNAIARFFRSARPPVIGRIKDGSFQLDLRAVDTSALLAVEFPAVA